MREKDRRTVLFYFIMAGVWVDPYTEPRRFNWKSLSGGVVALPTLAEFRHLLFVGSISTCTRAGYLITRLNMAGRHQRNRSIGEEEERGRR